LTMKETRVHAANTPTDLLIICMDWCEGFGYRRCDLSVVLLWWSWLTSWYIWQYNNHIKHGMWPANAVLVVYSFLLLMGSCNVYIYYSYMNMLKRIHSFLTIFEKELLAVATIWGRSVDRLDYFQPLPREQIILLIIIYGVTSLGRQRITGYMP
jgi:hypothetical protein